MCVDYTDLSRVYSKDSYSLPNTDKQVYNLVDCKLLSCMDAYLSYNQILVFKEDMDKTSFMIERANYRYNVMSFGL